MQRAELDAIVMSTNSAMYRIIKQDDELYYEEIRKVPTDMPAYPDMKKEKDGKVEYFPKQ